MEQIEPAALHENATDNDRVQLSIAISLKRIADKLATLDDLEGAIIRGADQALIADMHRRG
jgi:hypothetical protein